jgi:hypothetical protein
MFKKFNSIGQFRNVVKQICDNCEFHNEPKPTINFTGTVKLHGTNAAVVGKPTGEIFTQSRTRIISLNDDNAGFAAFVAENKDFFRNIIRDLIVELDNTTVFLYGEWCGGNIQSNIGLNKLSKRFVIFQVDFVNETGNVKSVSGKDLSAYHNSQEDHAHNTFWISEFPSYEITIDFNNPEEAIEKLQDLTDSVEQECPAAKAMGAEGDLIGEGIVWVGLFKNEPLLFKTKGEKHKNSVKTPKKPKVSIAPETFEKIKEFSSNAVLSRADQALEEVFTRNNKIADIRGTGDFIRWTLNDILKEEEDTIIANGFDISEVKKIITQEAKNWFFSKFN